MTDFSKKPPISENYRERKWVEQISRELSWCQMNELTPQPTGSKWVDQSDICRVVVDCGALPNTTSKAVAHGLTFSQITRIYGISSDGTYWLPLPYVSETTTWVRLIVDATDILLRTGANLTAFATTYVTLEFIK